MNNAFVKHDIHILFKDYSKSVYKWFLDHTQLPFYDSETKMVFSTPDKAFAKLVVPLRNGQYEGCVGSLYLSNTTFNEGTPGGFVWREELITNRDGTPKIFDDGKFYRFREFAASLYDLTYTFTLWGRLKRDLSYVFSNIMKKTSKRRPVAWKLHNHWVILKSDGNIRDESDLEPGAEKEKVLRWSMDFIIERAVLPGPYELIPVIAEVDIEMNSKNSDGSFDIQYCDQDFTEFQNIR